MREIVFQFNSWTETVIEESENARLVECADGDIVKLYRVDFTSSLTAEKGIRYNRNRVAYNENDAYILFEELS